MTSFVSPQGSAASTGRAVTAKLSLAHTGIAGTHNMRKSKSHHSMLRQHEQADAITT